MSAKTKKAKPTPKRSRSKGKSNAGRPTKYDPKYCKDVVEWMKSPSNSFDSFAAHIGVCVETVNEWARVHPEFSAAKKRAKALQEREMQKIGLSGINGEVKGFAQAAWIFWMKARYGWREDGPMDDDEMSDLEIEIDGLKQ